MGKKFDDLSKALASGMSRRQVLKGAFGGLGAATLGSLIPGRNADAQTAGSHGFHGPTPCEQFCTYICQHPYSEYYGGNSQQTCTDTCIAESRSGQGPCYTIAGAPGYRYGCSGNDGCPPDEMCCNGRCCKPDLCVTINGGPPYWLEVNGTGGFQINGGEYYFGNQYCVGCGPTSP